MRKPNQNTHRLGLHFLLAVTLMTMGLFAGLVQAQENALPTDRNQAQIQQQIRENINNDPGLDRPQRERMMSNLEGCVQHGMNMEQVQALFPIGGEHGTGHAEQMLAMQDRVLGLADMDLPVGPMMGKIMEGRMKHVPSDRMERVLEQTGDNIRFSRRMMVDAIEGGVQGPGTHEGMHAANSELAHCMWDGLREQDMERLREQAMHRARDGGCSMDEFVAASQAATRFSHGGMNHDQAVSMAGEAMHNGYSADDMRTMGYMMMSSTEMGDHHTEMMDHMEGWISEGMSMDEMTQHMMEGGWMGPADMMGAGGHNGMDNMGWGGPGHDDGMHGGGGHGGMGGGDGGMGGGDGGMGGGDGGGDHR